MQIGWLIYNQVGAKRNEWFIRRLQSEAEKYGVFLQLLVANAPNELPMQTLPDFAIVRAMNADINAHLQEKGVRVANNAQTACTAGDKWQTYLLCKQLNIPVLDTVLANEQTIKNAKYPCVVKSRFGHGGREVFWVKDKMQAGQISEKSERFILQKPNDILGVDTRVYAVGNEIVAAVKRTSKSDFRSNFSLGGSAELVEATDEQKEIVARLYKHLHFDCIGIDFLPSKDGVVLNELEDAAGTRMLYACGKDIVPKYIEHILQK